MAGLTSPSPPPALLPLIDAPPQHVTRRRLQESARACAALLRGETVTEKTDWCATVGGQ